MRSRSVDQRPWTAAAFGIVLIIVGLVALAGRQLGLDLGELIGAQGWPFFVIVPGVVLLVAAALPVPPEGLGLAIAGSIVTTIGLILLYQASTGHWSSWAYVWALIPAAAGLGMAIYGLATHASARVSDGLRLVVIGGALAALGFWYFETIFETGRVPVDLGQWWPVLVIAAGLLTVGSAVLKPRGPARPTTGSPATPTQPELGGEAARP
jgi:vacuolar-type H+-ATPase subunit I/STV1